jgi:glycosyltransferase involved in cell wall biosynthesis
VVRHGSQQGSENQGIADTLKVLVLTTSFPLAENPASGVFVSRLVESLASKHEITVLTPCYKKSFTVSARNKAYWVKCFPYGPPSWQVLAHEPGGIPVALKKNPRLFPLLPVFLGSMLVSTLLYSRKNDLIHANWSINGAIASFAGILANRPVLTTLRGSDVNRAKKSPADLFILKLCGLFSGIIVTVSESLREETSRLINKKRHDIRIVENGVGDNFFEMGKKTNYKKSSSPFTITTIGNLFRGKGVETLIDACANLSLPVSYMVEIVGEGPEKDKLQKKAKNTGIKDRIRFAGKVSHEQIPWYLSGSDVFVLCSFSEGRPNVVLEAMATGVPVIATDIEGVRGIVEDNVTGLLFEPGNDRELTDRLKTLFEDPELRALLGRGGRRLLIQKGLTWDNCANRYEKIYRQLVAKKME